MRRKDREVKTIGEIFEIVERCTVFTLSINDADTPYSIPLNLGADFINGNIHLYFHCAKEGYKLNLLKADNKVAFEMHTSEQYIPGLNACNGTMRYESICGCGVAVVIEGEAKNKALGIIMRQHTGRSDFSFTDRETECVTVFEIRVNKITGKRNI